MPLRLKGRTRSSFHGKMVGKNEIDLDDSPHMHIRHPATLDVFRILVYKIDNQHKHPNCIKGIHSSYLQMPTKSLRMTFTSFDEGVTSS